MSFWLRQPFFPFVFGPGRQWSGPFPVCTSTAHPSYSLWQTHQSVHTGFPKAHLLCEVKAMTFSKSLKVLIEQQLNYSQICICQCTSEFPQWLSISNVFLGYELPVISTENTGILYQALVKVGVEGEGIMFFMRCRTSSLTLIMKAESGLRVQTSG